MTKKTWIIFCTICVLLVGGLIYLSNSNKLDVSDVDVLKSQSASKMNGQIADHTYGNMDSKVILLEYGDYQCPGCGDAYPIIKQVVEKYKDEMGFIFRNYPLSSMHPNALSASTTAEAAGLEGKFWEMHDLLYQNQSSWNQLTGADRTDYFVNTAKSLGIDGKKVEDILNGTSGESSRVTKKIQFDQSLGRKQNVTGTPSVYLNGKLISDLKSKDGKLVSSDTAGAQYVWSDASALDNLVVKPLLQSTGMLKK